MHKTANECAGSKLEASTLAETFQFMDTFCTRMADISEEPMLAQCFQVVEELMRFIGKPKSSWAKLLDLLKKTKSVSSFGPRGIRLADVARLHNGSGLAGQLTHELALLDEVAQQAFANAVVRVFKHIEKLDGDRLIPNQMGRSIHKAETAFTRQALDRVLFGQGRINDC